MDGIESVSHKAVLRWRLAPGLWRLEGETVINGNHSLSVSSSVPIVRMEIVTGFESRHYLELSEIPVLELEVARAGTLESEYRWAQGKFCISTSISRLPRRSEESSGGKEGVSQCRVG